jgi:hypothetical protein
VAGESKHEFQVFPRAFQPVETQLDRASRAQGAAELAGHLPRRRGGDYAADAIPAEQQAMLLFPSYVVQGFYHAVSKV